MFESSIMFESYHMETNNSKEESAPPAYVSGSESRNDSKLNNATYTGMAYKALLFIIFFGFVFVMTIRLLQNISMFENTTKYVLKFV